MDWMMVAVSLLFFRKRMAEAGLDRIMLSNHRAKLFQLYKPINITNNKKNGVSIYTKCK